MHLHKPAAAAATAIRSANTAVAWVAAAIVIASLIAHTYRIADLPSGFYVDESSIAYNAHLIAESGHDEHGVAFPLFFKAFGEYKNPVYIYLLALAYKCFGYSEWTTRLLSAACWAAGSGLTYLLGRRLFTDGVSRLYLLICLGFTPWLFSLSRISFEVIVLFPVLALFLLATTRAYQDHSPGWALVAGTAIGVSIYAYSTFRLLAPLHLLAVVLSFPQRRFWRLHCFLAVGAVLAFLPYIAYTVDHFANLTQRFSGITYLNRNDLTAGDKIATFVKHYAGYFDPSFLAMDGDHNRRHHTGFGGELLLPSAVMLVLGVVTLVVRGQVISSPFVRLLLFGLLLAPMAAALTSDTQHSLRAFSMVIFAVLLSVYGVRYLARWRLDRVIVLLTAANAGLYVVHYFSAYPPVSAVAFENYGFREALLRARSMARGKIIISNEGNQPYINMLFFDSVLPDPQRKVPVVLGNRDDLRDGDVLVYPARPGDTTDREGLDERSLYAVRPYEP
jgi:4-amino-4-deoxy-L-arabinose transferase-like glycosyltransferase